MRIVAPRRHPRLHLRLPLRGAALLLAALGVAWLAPEQVQAQTQASPAPPQAMSPQAMSPQAASAQLRVRSLAAQCAQCHGTDGHAVAGNEVPGIAGMPAGYLAEQLRAFRAGTRPATVMQQLAKGYSDAQIEQLARYFAAQAAPQAPAR